MKFTREQVMGVVRHTLTFLGGIAIAKGYASDATVTEIIGAVVTLVGAVWSVMAKK
jgi:hypothetical protein